MSASMHRLPLHECPRERLARFGVEALSERELLALVLRGGHAGCGALGVADAVLDRFVSLEGMGRCDATELACVPGVGSAKAASIVAAFGIGSRANRSEAPTVIGAAEDIAAIAQARVGRSTREQALVVVCDTGNRVRHVDLLTSGAADRTLLPVREVLQSVLRRDGNAFAVAHNHPSGDASPSVEDVSVTRKLHRAAEVVGVRFLDHVVVTPEDWCCVPY